MTKVLILIFTVLLALNIHASDTRPVKESSTTGVNGVISGNILIGLTDHYGPKYKSSAIKSEVYFEIIERSQDELSLIINYNDYTLELFYDEYLSQAKFTLFQDGHLIPEFDDTQKKQFNYIISSLKSNMLRILPKPYPRIKSLVSIFELLNHLTEGPNDQPVHGVKKNQPHHYNSLRDEPTTSLTWSPFITMICDKIGKPLVATYRPNPGEWTRTEAIVGDPATECLGRSGTGCAGEWVWIELPWWLGGYSVPTYYKWQKQYTYESFNHDVCVRDHGYDSLHCAEALISATPGYLAAPSCPD